MVISIELFLGFEGMEIFGGLVGGGVLVYGKIVMMGWVFEGVEDVFCIFVLVVCRVVFGFVWGR